MDKYLAQDLANDIRNEIKAHHNKIEKEFDTLSSVMRFTQLVMGILVIIGYFF